MPRDDISSVGTGGDVRARVRAVVASGRLSQAEVARQSDLPASTLSQWLNDRYPADGSVVEAKLARWLDTQAAVADVAELLPKLPSYVETPTGQRIVAALRYAQSARTIALIHGAPGIGKTRAIKHYRRIASAIWIVTADPMLSQMGALLDRAATVLGIPDGRRDPASLRKAIIAKLRGTGGLLIIDEAQHLSDKAIEAVRCIHDAVNEDLDDDDPGLGVALIGNAALYARISAAGRGHDFAQVTSRVGKPLRLEGVTEGDVRALAAAFRLDGADEVAAVREISRRPGGLRLVEQTLRQAWMLAAGEVPPARPRLEHIQAAFAELMRDETV